MHFKCPQDSVFTKCTACRHTAGDVMVWVEGVWDNHKLGMFKATSSCVRQGQGPAGTWILDLWFLSGL